MWLPADDDFLKKNYQKLSDAQIAKNLGKSEKSVRKRIKEFGLKTPMPKKNNARWKDEENTYIKSHYQQLSVRQIAIYLNRSEKATRGKIERLGLKLDTLHSGKYRSSLSPKWSETEIELLLANMDLTATQIHNKFLPDRAVHSIYTKLLRLGKKKKTSKGYHYTSDGRKMVYIKHGVSIPEHRLVVEKDLGRKLKRTEIVHHIDCNKKNNNLENLHVFKNISNHMATHHSLNALIPKLLSNEIIKFDRNIGKYVFKKK